MKKIYFLTLLTGLVFNSHSQVGSPINMGANVPDVTDYSGTPIFVDLMKQSRPPMNFADPFSSTAPLPTLDANGWPLGDCAIWFIASDNDWKQWIDGVYKLSFTGKADISFCCSGAATIQNKVYDSNTNTTTADITFTTDSGDPNGESLMIKFGNTVGGVKNIKLIRPNEDPNALFTQSFINHLKRFSVLRFMDMGRTNGSQEKDFTKRRKPEYATQSANKDPRGVSFEYMAELANVTGADAWVNVPLLADDNYVREMAKVFKAKLNPERKLYVEYSNELWNGGFSQFHKNEDLAVAEVTAGGTTLNKPLDNGTPSDTLDWAFRRVAKRGMEVGNIVRDVFGETTALGRVRPILAWQFAVPHALRFQMLSFITKHHGNPDKFFYALASAPYISGTNAEIEALHNNSNSTPQNYVDQLKSDAERQYAENFNGTGTGQKLFDHWITVAKFYGLKHVLYEAGQHLNDPNQNRNVGKFSAANLDPQMESIFYNYYKNFQKTSPDGFALQYMAGSDRYTKYGCWTLNEDWHTVESAPKTKGIDKFLDDVVPETTVGWKIANVLDSVDTRKHTWGAFSNTNTWNLGVADNTNLNKGQFNGYLINVKQHGTYSLKLRTKIPITAGKKHITEVWMNNVLVDSIVVTNTGASYGGDSKFIVSDSIEIELPLGLSAIELRYRNSTGFTSPSANKAMLFRLIKKNVTSVEETTERTISLYPNPVTNGKLNIQGEELLNDVEFYNMQGACVFKTTASNELEVSHLMNGLYLLKLQTKSGITTQKIMIQNQ